MDIVLVMLGFVVVVTMLVVWMRRSDGPSTHARSCDGSITTYVVVDTIVESLIDD